MRKIWCRSVTTGMRTVTDILTAKADFPGKLGFRGLRRASRFSLNVDDPGYDPLFAYGYGGRSPCLSACSARTAD